MNEPAVLGRHPAGRHERDVRERAAHSRTNDGPSAEAGKTFMAAAPARHAARISVGVAAPGNAGMPRSAAQRHELRVGVGHDEERRAGIDGGWRRSIDSTVPAPIATAEPLRGARPRWRGTRRPWLVEGDLEGPDAALGECLGDGRRGRAVERRRAMATTPPATRPAGIAGRVVETVTRSEPPTLWTVVSGQRSAVEAAECY